MKKLPILESASSPRVTLRPATLEDIEDLRVWKNANKQWFFFKGDITVGQQQEWFKGYLSRDDEALFIVEHEGVKAGTLGVRFPDAERADIFNVIAAPGMAGKGLMKAALTMLCTHVAAKKTKNIGCLVLKGNPAAKFYESCGFKKTEEEKIHDIFALDAAAFKPVEYTATLLPVGVSNDTQTKPEKGS